MTGLGRARANNEEVAIEVTVKSVNHRGIDIKYRLPNELVFLEEYCSSLICETVDRGRIEVQANIESLMSKVSTMVFDEDRAEALLLRLQKLRERFPKIDSRITMGDLMSVPRMVTDIEQVLPELDVKTLAIKALKEALTDLQASRGREGALLISSLKEMLRTCRDLIGSIGDAVNADVNLRFNRFKARIDELFGSYEINEDRLYQEFALLAERSDFKEEIDRLRAHVEHFDSICHEATAKGRKLDFLCQEMLRESNTLLSKAFDHSAMIKAIELKAEIERIREQVQNIE